MYGENFYARKMTAILRAATITVTIKTRMHRVSWNAYQILAEKWKRTPRKLCQNLERDKINFVSKIKKKKGTQRRCIFVQRLPASVVLRCFIRAIDPLAFCSRVDQILLRCLDCMHLHLKCIRSQYYALQQQYLKNNILAERDRIYVEAKILEGKTW